MNKNVRDERRKSPRGRWHVWSDAVYTTLRFIARHVQGFFGAVAAYLSLGFLLAAIAIGLFALIGLVVGEGVTQRVDEAVVSWVEQHRTPLGTAAMLEITSLGNGLVLVILVAVASTFLWLTGHNYSVATLIFAVVGGQGLNAILKAIYDRPRPSVVEWASHASSASFPSGHAMSSFIVYGSIAYLVGRLEPTARLRRTTYALAALLIVAIGTSRVYLGVHYPSDVLAGFVAGLAWIAFAASTLPAVRFFADRRPEVETEERDLHAEEERAMGIRA